MLRLGVFGSTGSIGLNTLEVVRANENIAVTCLANRSQVEVLAEQVREFSVPLVAVSDAEAATRLKVLLGDQKVRILVGEEGLNEAASCCEADVMVAAVSGFAGLRSVIAGITAGKHIALANKEALVAGGEIVLSLARKHDVLIVPVDSEHSSIFQCLSGQSSRGQPVSITITASGGPFLRRTLDELQAVTVSEAANHPRWSMGRKISIDSATMMNKGLEIIEAARLFSLKSSQIKVLIHPQSLVHGYVQFADGGIVASLFNADMKVPIACALMAIKEKMGGEVLGNGCPGNVRPFETKVRFLDLAAIGQLNFEEADVRRFPAISLAYRALDGGDMLPIAFNAANEVAVQRFVNGDVRFSDIVGIVEGVLAKCPCGTVSNIEDVFTVDSWARESASNLEM